MQRHRSSDSPRVAVESAAVESHAVKHPPSKWTAASILKIALVVIVLGGVVYLAKLTLQPKLKAFLDSLETNPQGTVAVFMAVTFVAVLLLCPGPVMAVAGGAAYGVKLGFPVCFVAIVAAQAVAFLLGRVALRRPLSNYLRQNVKMFPSIESAVERVGWKLVMALRLSPVLPDSLLNYVFSVTPLNFVPYMLASSATQVLYCGVYVYVGSVSKSMIHGGDDPAHQWRRYLTMGLSAIAVVGSSWFIIRFANGIVTSALKDSDTANAAGRSAEGDVSEPLLPPADPDKKT